MSSDWTIEIRPKKKWFDVDIKNLWRYRDLYYMYVKRDIITVYKQTVLGPLWFVIQPVFTTIMYMFVFGGLAGISTDGAPQPLFYLSGIMLWNYFSTCFSISSNIFISNAGIFGKVYFPRLVVPLAGITSNLIKMLIQLCLFIAVYIYFYFTGAELHVNWTIILFPFLVFLIAFHAMSWGMIISSMTTKYRDLQVLFSFFVSLWMYATPIVYPLSQTNSMRWLGIPVHTLMCLNPVTSIIETFKYGFLGAGEFVGWRWLIYSFIFMMVLLTLGIVVFNKVQKSFMDTV